MTDKEILLNLLPDDIINKIKLKYNINENFTFSSFKYFCTNYMDIEDFIRISNNVNEECVLVKNEILYQCSYILLRTTKVRKNENYLRELKIINKRLKLLINNKRKRDEKNTNDLVNLIDNNIIIDYKNKKKKYNECYNLLIFDENIITNILSYLDHHNNFILRGTCNAFYKCYLNLKRSNIIILNDNKRFVKSILIAILTLKDIEEPDDIIKNIILNIEKLRYKKEEKIISYDNYNYNLKKELINFIKLNNLGVYYCNNIYLNSNFINNKEINSIVYFNINEIESIFNKVKIENLKIERLRIYVNICYKYNVNTLIINIIYLELILKIIVDNNIILPINDIILCDKENNYNDKNKVEILSDYIRKMNKNLNKLKRIFLLNLLIDEEEDKTKYNETNYIDIYKDKNELLYINTKYLEYPKIIDITNFY